MPPHRIYLDHAASTPLLPAAREAMIQALGAGGNPSSPHAAGRHAKDLLEAARSRAARALDCRAREIVFTASGTIASQLAFLGAARARRRQSTRIVLSAVEHPAIAEAADLLAAEGYEVDRVPPSADGSVDPGLFIDHLEGNAAAAALMLAHHETAALLPVATVAREMYHRGIPLICDACLGPGRVPARTTDLGADLTIYSAHKMNGPRGIGILHVRRGTRVEAAWRRGLQEERLHPGTENVAGAVGAALALEIAVTSQADRAPRYEGLLDHFLRQLDGCRPWTRIGPAQERLPGLATLLFPGVEGEAAMINMDLERVDLSTGSVCALGATEPSPSLLALGHSRRAVASTLRVSMGEGLDDDDVTRAARVLTRTVVRLRRLAGSGGR